MQINGTTTPFAVLGHPVAHTLSPPMHNANLEALGMNAIYAAYDVVPEKLMEVLHGMQAMGFQGVNLTIPHKQVAFAGIEQLDASAQLVGGVNTVQFTEDGLVGHSTDGYGFLKDLEEQFDFSVEGKSIYLFGCGGAGRAAALTAASAGAATVILKNRSPERAIAVKEEIDALGLSVEVIHDTSDNFDLVRAADLVVNGTSIGMKPEDAPPLPREAFREGQYVYDMIYVVPETAFMRPAREAGAKAANGLGMLLHQGVRSFEIWTGREAAVETMRAVLAARFS